MPVLAMCRSSGRELARFHRFIRPGYWDAFPDDMHRQSARPGPAAAHGGGKNMDATSHVVGVQVLIDTGCPWPELLPGLCKVTFWS